MKNRPAILLISVIVGLIVIAVACSAGFFAGQIARPVTAAALNPVMQALNLPSLSVGSQNGIGDSQALSTGNQGSTPKDLQTLFEPFWQAWKLVHAQYVDQPVDDTQLMRGAIKGMLDSLGDEHTSYLDPTHFDLLNKELNGEQYEGIGAWVDVRGEYLTIISPMPGSPAEKAGLKPGDQVIAVDGKDMTGVDGEVVRKQIIGPKGTQVTLKIKRDGVDQPYDVEVVRDSITVPTIESKMLDGNIGYVRLYTFGENTADDLNKALATLMNQNPKGLILDLRYNGGGLLSTAIDVASEFIGDGVVMVEAYGDGTQKVYDAKPGGLATKIPLVVLINEGSASASEIVAGAIHDRGRGQLVGVKSFGKGSVQIFTPLIDSQGAIRVTVARWLTPNGTTINKIGLTPDVEVKITDQDIKANLDPQLDKAIELLKNNQ